MRQLITSPKLLELRKYMDISKTPIGTKLTFNPDEKMDQSENDSNLDKFCYYFNLELDIENLSKKGDPKLILERDLSVRYYEKEAIRLVESLRRFNKDIRIICLMEDVNYDQGTLNNLDRLKVERVLMDFELPEFNCGYDKIPFCGMVLEDYYLRTNNPGKWKRQRRVNRTRTSYNLVPLNEYAKDTESDEWLVPKYLIKLDTDMVQLKPLPQIFFDTVKTGVVFTGIYDRDDETIPWYIEGDSPERTKVINFNTCFIASSSEDTMYTQWYESLLKFQRAYNKRTGMFSADAEEISHGFNLNWLRTIFLGNFQTGPNYQNLKDMTIEQVSKVYFYHGPINPDTDLIKDISNTYIDYKLNYSKMIDNISLDNFDGMYFKEMEEVDDRKNIWGIAYYKKFNIHLNRLVDANKTNSVHKTQNNKKEHHES